MELSLYCLNCFEGNYIFLCLFCSGSRRLHEKLCKLLPRPMGLYWWPPWWAVLPSGRSDLHHQQGTDAIVMGANIPHSLWVQQFIEEQWQRGSASALYAKGFRFNPWHLQLKGSGNWWYEMTCTSDLRELLSVRLAIISFDGPPMLFQVELCPSKTLGVKGST